ncbi:aldehyde dehydrogenase [Leptodontidium sp. 2 PMI_412]|nr:aldehyde dehydrogenase [Leptodontidium sp. 2 PMI_412]
MAISFAKGGGFTEGLEKIEPETRHFINGKFVESSDKKTFILRSPATLEVTAEVSEASADDTNAAVAAAKAAHPAWAALDPLHRGKCLKKLAQLLRESQKELAYLEAIAMGKPIRFYQENFIAANQFDYYAEAARGINGSSSLNTPGFFNVTIKVPYGVVAAIIPWNGPMIFVATKLAPSLAAGNTVVLKSSEKSPLSSTYFATLVAKSGFPPGVVNVLSGHGSAGATLASHMDVRALTFTGSVATGRKVQEAAAKSNMKNVYLELGGKSPAIIFDDCDLQAAVQATAFSVLYNCGQVCVSNTRIYVHEAVAAEFIDTYKERFLAAKSGDPLDLNTSHGPLADEIQYNNVKKYIELGCNESNKLVGGMDATKAKGWFVEPTIFVDSPENSRIMQEEIFGPVVSINTFKTEEEALFKANNSEFGLYSSVWTNDINRALRFAKALEAGTISVNCTSPTIFDDMAFGGLKSSGGGGKEGFLQALDNFLEQKSVLIKMDGAYQI